MPTAPVPAETIDAVVQSACRAPSFHNSQPWRWELGHGQLHLFIDPDRVVDTDHTGCETVISCGAALDHLRVASAAAGWAAVVQRGPDPADPRHLASVGFVPQPGVTEDQRRRADAIGRRRTDRLPLAAPPRWDAVVPALRSALDDAEVFVDVIPDDATHRVTAAAHLSETLRLYDSAYHAELNWWTAPFDTHDGIPASALISAAESDRVEVGRNFPVTAVAERRTDLAQDRAKIVVLSTRDDTAASVLRCGEALSAVLLECTLAGLATCTLTHITEVRASREVLSTVTARPNPQLLIRVGAAPDGEEPVPTPRRPVADVLRYRI